MHQGGNAVSLKIDVKDVKKHKQLFIFMFKLEHANLTAT